MAVLLNFILPRLMPGDPVAVIVSRSAQGMSEASAVKEIYDQYAEAFGINDPMIIQFFTYFKNALKGDYGLSFS